MGYLSNPAQFARCQAAYDNMSPPDEYCPECGREASCDCICDGFATEEELEDAALELEIERMEAEELAGGGMNHLSDNFYVIPAAAQTTMTTKQLSETLLATDGAIIACGYFWDIKHKSLGAGVQKVFLKKQS